MRPNPLLRIWLFLLCLSLSSFVLAQSRNVTGTVVDEKGTTLPGASITVKGTSKTTGTNVDGKFSIELPDNANTLVISFIGMETQEVVVGKNNTVSVKLISTATAMADVVVIGYGTTKRANVTTAISSVKAKDLKDMPVAGIDQALQGRVAGVSIANNSGTPGGGVSIHVRGITSINSNDPLVVIDGVLFPGNTRSTTGFAGLGGANGQTGNSVLATLNPGDIESIDILKDASAQAIYGSQAANGVILITTKKGKAGDGKINYDVYYGQAKVPTRLDLMNLQEFAKYYNEVAVTPMEELQNPDILGKGTDWQEAMFRTGQIQNHQLSFSGGKDKTTYYLSGNYFKQTGTLNGSDFTRYATRFNMDHELKKWMKIGISTNVTRSIQNVTLADAAPGAIWDMAILSPLTPVKNLDGTWAAGSNIIYNGQRPDISNPIAESHFRGTKNTSSQVFGSVYADILLPKGLSFKNEFAYSLGMNNNVAYQKAGRIGTRPELQSQLADYRGNSYYWALRNYLNYQKYTAKHGITATLGHEAQYSYYEGISGGKLKLQNNILDLNAGSTTPTDWQLGGGRGDWAMESYFVRGTYAYDNRYFVNLSLRGDGASNFGTNKRWGYFPGGSVAWNITNENFAQSIKSVVNDLKLRVGYGAVGNQNLPSGAPTPPFTANVLFWPGPVGFDTASYITSQNPNLGWEAVVTKNIGIDAAFLNNRISLAVDLYKKTTTNMLMFGVGGTTIGLGENWDDMKAPVVNVGQMSNTGVDISLNATVIDKKGFNWRSTVIFSHYKNKLEKMNNSTAGLQGKVYYDGYTITYTDPGYPVGSFFGYKTDGLFRTQADLDNSLPQFNLPVAQDRIWLGDVRYKDISGPNGKPDGIIDTHDLTYIGSPLPKFTYGFTNNFTYQNFDLAVFLQGSYGAKIFNFLKHRTERMDVPFLNQSRAVLDRYTETNTNGSLPRYVAGVDNNIQISDRYVEDGSYLRIQNITLGYRVPVKYTSKLLMTNVRFYLSVQNLHTFTKYSGLDPEIGSFNNNFRLTNVDVGHYPNPRTFTIGANIEF
jgi:TonB-linked SusC/RagA family outer membrane protein